VPRDAARNPLFDVMFSLQELEGEEPPGDTGAEDIRAEDIIKISKFDLTLGAVAAEKIYLSFEYCTKLFKKETIERFVSYFNKIVTAVITGSGQAIAEIEIISEEERKQVLVEFNDSESDYPRDMTIHQLFEEQVERTPDNIAVVSPGTRFSHLTYRELNKKANQPARVLRGKGVTSGRIVAVIMEPSIRMVIALIAVLKAGGAYLPVDSKYPEERNKFMLEDTGVENLLIQPHLIPGNSNILNAAENIIDMDDENLYSGESVNLNLINNVNDPAYAMYTSGSTGKPKGVVIEHRNAVNVLSWFGKTFNLGIGTHVLQLTDFTFDPSVEDIFGSLIHGAVLYVVDTGLTSDKYDFSEFVNRHQVHIINFVPTMLDQLLCHEKEMPSLRVVISGGEALEDSVKDRIIAGGYRLYNNYGPVETTVDALAGECSPGKVSLGKPVANVKCYILDGGGSPVPVGITGELCISGAGVCRGYLNMPEHTHEKFVKNPFAGGETMFRTGDLARFLADGNVEFLGRRDHQVKIRGYRIELGEIRNRLLKHRDVPEAVVLVREDEAGDKYICAYIVAGPAESA
ncbi:MAG: amino acid adenylation domain-containing protein, partial [bacterium]|nr:amino acid adenylation domain-containing protein [bacterium]